jgi:hypothetical protein
LPDPKTLLLVEDSYLYQSEYLKASLLDQNSGPVAIISDSNDIMTSMNTGYARLLLRPILKRQICELINQNILQAAESSVFPSECTSGESSRDYRYIALGLQRENSHGRGITRKNSLRVPKSPRM